MIRLTNEQGKALWDTLGHIAASSSYPGIREGLESIDAQLKATNHFDDLIDTVVGLVSDPRISSLNRDHLSALRRAILSPVELSVFTTKYNNGVVCSTCARQFQSYEAATIVNKNIHCYSCAHPEMISCHSCSEHIDISSIKRTIDRATQRHVCSPTAPTPQPPVPELSYQPAPARRMAPTITRVQSAGDASLQWRYITTNPTFVDDTTPFSVANESEDNG